MKKIDGDITYDQMKGTVGSLLSIWSQIERALNAGLIKLNPDEPPMYGFSSKLDLWSKLIIAKSDDRPLQREVCQRLRTHLSDALDVRNLVCHGLVGISAGYREDVACLTVELNEKKRILTWPELQAMFPWMSEAQWCIEFLTAAAMEKNPARAAKILPNMRHFPE